MTAIDVSRDALALARENVERTGLAVAAARARHRRQFSQLGGPYDLVVSDPPYVERAELAAPDPRRPATSSRYRRLVGDPRPEVVARRLGVAAPGGHLVLEIGAGQALRRRRAARRLRLCRRRDDARPDRPRPRRRRAALTDVGEAAAAIRDGGLAIVPTDTGLRARGEPPRGGARSPALSRQGSSRASSRPRSSSATSSCCGALCRS